MRSASSDSNSSALSSIISGWSQNDPTARRGEGRKRKTMISIRKRRRRRKRDKEKDKNKEKDGYREDRDGLCHTTTAHVKNGKGPLSTTYPPSSHHPFRIPATASQTPVSLCR